MLHACVQRFNVMENLEKFCKILRTALTIIAWTTKPLTAILSSLVQISKEDIPRGFTCSHAQAHKPSQRKTQHVMFWSMRLMEF